MGQVPSLVANSCIYGCFCFWKSHIRLHMTTDSSLDLEILKYSDLPTQVLYIIVCKRIKLEVFKILENQMENFKFNIIIKMFSGFSH